MESRKILKVAAISLLSLSLLLSCAAVAYAATPASFWKSFDISSKYIWLPDLVGNFFDGAQINLHFRMVSGETLDVCGNVEKPEYDGAHARPAGIYGLSWAVCREPDYDVSMSDANAISLATSTAPMRTFSSLQDGGSIAVTPYGEGNAAKYRYAKANFLSMDGQAVPQGIREYFGQFQYPEASGSACISG